MTAAEDIVAMAADRTPTRRTRARMATNETDGSETLSWSERRWRESVDSGMKELAKQQQDTALILQGVLTEIKEMRNAPKEARAWFSTANGALATMLSAAAIVISIILFILQHVRWQ